MRIFWKVSMDNQFYSFLHFRYIQNIASKSYCRILDCIWFIWILRNGAIRIITPHFCVKLRHALKTPEWQGFGSGFASSDSSFCISYVVAFCDILLPCTFKIHYWIWKPLSVCFFQILKFFLQVCDFWKFNARNIISCLISSFFQLCVKAVYT